MAKLPKLEALSMLLCVPVLGAALTGCGSDDFSDATKDAPMSAAIIAFNTEQDTWREQRRADLLEPDGWASLTGLHWVERGAHFIGSAADNGIRLTIGPAYMGMIELEDDALRFVPHDGTELTLDGEPLSAATGLRADDDDPANPSTIGFDQGKGMATVIKRGERYALRVRHAEAPTRTGFNGLDYWPAERDWKITGTFVPNPPGQTIAVANIVGTIDDMPNPGAIEFERDGAGYRIEALDDGSDELFLVFADRTSGHGSYGAGRFLYVPRPDADGRVAIDFNHSYNPPCAFTAFATCPLPPPENRLDLAITAGEKAYEQ